MNAPPLDRYRVLLTQLLFEREAAGGDLSEDEESRYVALLDDVWWQLSASEQEQIERELMQVPVQVSEDPSLVDLAVIEGTNALPRRAA
jgi:hypothetical protein